MNDPMSINEAARLTGLSIPTIRAKLDKGLLPNAKKVKQGKRNSWQIPLNDLLDAELVKPQPDQEETDKVTELERKIENLTKDLDHTRELLAARLEELEAYKQRERQLFNAIETRETQEKRRRFWLFG
jgi:DNA-binding transcriptional MerR regulator